MKKIGIFLTIAVLFSGCASAPPTGHLKGMTWYQPGVSAEQMERDLAACQYYAIENVGGYSVQGNTLGQTMLLSSFAQSEQRSRENQMIQTHMVALGYSLVKTNSPLLGTPVAVANIVEIERAKAEKGDSEALFDLGNLYCFGFTNNACRVAIDYTEAIKWFQKAADQNYPNIQLPLAAAYMRRSALEIKNGQLDAALADCDKAVEIRPDNTEVYVLRGALRLEKGDLDGAMADFNNVIALNPKDEFAYAGRAEVYYELHKFADALADYRMCCQVNSDVRLQDGCHFNIWACRGRLGEPDAATKELQSYLDNRKIGAPNDFELKVCDYLVGQFGESQLFKNADNADEQTAEQQLCEAYLIAGTKRLIDGDKTAAIDYFEKCLATETYDLPAHAEATAELKYLTASK